MSRDSVGHTLLVAGVLCVVCSLLVSASAVGLRPRQQRNKERERQRNILELTKLLRDDMPIADAFQQIDTRLVDLETGRYVPVAEIDPASFDQRRAASDPRLSSEIARESDLAGIRRRENYSLVYLVRKQGKIDQIVLPVRGKGLWSTMYGYVSLNADGKTIRGLTFVEHGETPGLGGEVDNRDWKDLWAGKQAIDEKGEVRIRVIKGAVDPRQADAEYQVDGLSGATLTANGVTNMLRYWLGGNGFGPFLARIPAEGEDA